LRSSLPSTRARKAQIWRTAGLAAALLLAIIGLDRSIARRSPQAVDPHVAGYSAAPSNQPLFRDGFETGTAASWAN